ncbi:hypothetical protein EUTSA_v10015949mg, partial [Eutrema salsugineum]
ISYTTIDRQSGTTRKISDGIGGSILPMLSHGLVPSALFLCVGVLYDRHKTRLVRYYGGLVSTIPNLSTIFFSFTLANMSSPGTSSFIGEFPILVGAFQRNSLVATLAALGMILGAAYSFWLYNRVFVRPLPFSLSVCNGWGGSRRSEVYRHANHQIRDWAPSQRFDGMAYPIALMSYENSWLETILMVLISGRNNKNQSPGRLVSLVIGDYLACLNAELLTLLVRMGVHPKVFPDCMHTSVSNLVQHGKFH